MCQIFGKTKKPSPSKKPSKKVPCKDNDKC